MSDPRPTVLITGGAGFIGCALSRRLLDAGFAVVAVDNLHPQIHPTSVRPALLPPDVDLVVADVTDADAWDDVLGRVTPGRIVHLAAETGTGQSLDEAGRHAHVNVVGTGRLLDALTRHGVRPDRLILSSSRAVYGEGAYRSDEREVSYPGARGHDALAAGRWEPGAGAAIPSRADRTWERPRSIYAATKLAQEHLMAAWAAARSVPLTVLRLQNVYGPGQAVANSYTGIVVLFCRLAREGRRIPLYEDGQVTRDFVYIDDVVDAFCTSLTRAAGLDATLDIGSGTATSILDLAQRVAATLGAPPPDVVGAFRDGDVRHASCDVERSRHLLGWQPRTDLADGLDRLIAWLAVQP